jgi:hypothetical protein
MTFMGQSVGSVKGHGSFSNSAFLIDEADYFCGIDAHIIFPLIN